MVRCTIVLDPDSLHSSHPWIECCLEAECEAAEHRVVCGNGVIVIIHVGIGEIRCSSAAFATSIAFPTSPPSTVSAVTAALLSFASLLCIVLVCDTLVAFYFRMIAVATVGAWG